MIEIKESGELLTEADIAGLERDIGCTLPGGYREFLLKQNGGIPIPDGFFVQRGLGHELLEHAVHFFYALGPSAPHAEIRSVWKRFEGRIPSELFPIGSDHFGNQICLGLCRTHVGEVLFWDHELEHAPPTYQNIKPLALTFVEFIDGLHERQRDWETPIDTAIRTDDVLTIEHLLASGTDLEATDQFGRTMLENAAIANAICVFESLHSRGANLRNSLSLAEENARFFPEHERMVKLIGHITRKQ